MVARTRAASAKAGGPHGHGGDDDGGFLVERLAFYESYHSNAANKVIHVICIPLIVWSVLVALRLVTFSVPNVTGFEANLGLLTTIAYGMFYLAADKSAGFTWCLFVGAPLYWLANQFAESPATTSSKLWWAFGAFVFGFYVQIHAGHYVFEKRKPALMDGFAEAMLSAPLFVWLEVIFFFGFRKDLRETVERKARVLIASYEKAS